MCRKMPKVAKKTTKKKPSRQEAVETGGGSNKIPVTEDGAEAAVLTDGDVQAGGSGTQGPTAEGGDESVEKSGSNTDSSVERARHRLMGRRQVRLISITEDKEDGGDKDS